MTNCKSFIIIIFHKPNDKYIADLAYIPNVFNNNNNNYYYSINSKYKYIFTIVYHFSKFAYIYLLTNKKKETILKKLKIFFDFYENPLELGTDNSRDFINNAVKNFLFKNNIKLVNALPNNTNKQVEIIHLKIRNMLLNIFLENINNFNIEAALIKVMNT